MKASNRRPCPAAMLALPWLALVIGCAGLDVSGLLPEDVTPQRRQRNADAVRLFEARRDFAEFQAAYACWEQGDLKGCKEQLEGLLERRPQHRDARLLMGDVCLAEERTAAAVEQLQLALQAHPHDAQVQHAMALLLDRTGRLEAALPYYQRAAEWEPENELYAVGYQTALAAGGGELLPGGTKPPQLDRTGNLTVTSRFASDPQTAGNGPRAGLAGAADIPPVDKLFDRGRAALAGGSFDVALACFQEAATRNPHNRQIPISAAVTALRYGQPGLAIELLEWANGRGGGSAQLYRVLGLAYYRLGDHRSSQVALQQALSLDKSSGLTYFLMGCTLAKLGQVESARAHLRQAQTIDPRYSFRR